jgi:hypothetical protein
VELRKQTFWTQFLSAESTGMGIFYTLNVFCIQASSLDLALTSSIWFSFYLLKMSLVERLQFACSLGSNVQVLMASNSGVVWGGRHCEVASASYSSFDVKNLSNVEQTSEVDS